MDVDRCRCVVLVSRSDTSFRRRYKKPRRGFGSLSDHDGLRELGTGGNRVDFRASCFSACALVGDPWVCSQSASFRCERSSPTFGSFGCTYHVMPCVAASGCASTTAIRNILDLNIRRGLRIRRFHNTEALRDEILFSRSPRVKVILRVPLEVTGRSTT